MHSVNSQALDTILDYKRSEKSNNFTMMFNFKFIFKFYFVNRFLTRRISQIFTKSTFFDIKFHLIGTLKRSFFDFFKIMKTLLNHRYKNDELML